MERAKARTRFIWAILVAVALSMLHAGTRECLGTTVSTLRWVEAWPGLVRVSMVAAVYWLISLCVGLYRKEGLLGLFRPSQVGYALGVAMAGCFGSLWGGCLFA
jgi:hypothetical protein